LDGTRGARVFEADGQNLTLLKGDEKTPRDKLLALIARRRHIAR